MQGRLRLSRNTSFIMFVRVERGKGCIQIQKGVNDCIYSYEGCR